MRALPRVARAGAVLGVAALALTGISPAHAADPPPLAGPPVAGSPQASPAASVTLITGDRAVVTTQTDGKRTAVLLPVQGADSTYVTRVVNEDIYLIPTRAIPLIKAGKLDERLFNVTALVDMGYDDARVKKLPVIAERGRFRAAPPASAAVVRDLPSAEATALEVDKVKAEEFWKELTQPMTRGAGFQKVWLDGKVRANLDQSVKQIGAPEAWAAGMDGKGAKVAVLDTGYDSKHPDLQGRVVASQDFTGSGSAEDDNYHGTHVASTVGGSGAAGDGARKGVAPGADLLIGKVLAYGSGQESWIIAGMEWAAAQGADVVNMSLGSNEPLVDCTDPMAAAVDRLSADGKTLFVIAAGNDAFRERVSTPGCAPSALTVGAVDRDGDTADFSSRGPVAGDHRLKPEISAPGVDITAARMGRWGGIPYMAMSGTSMASPHVAGAAAILSQKHPEWTNQQIKAALVTAAKPGASDGVYAQGAGVVDIPRALRQNVLAPTSLDLASYTWPHDKADKTTKDVTYTNLGDAPVTFDLSLDVRGVDGSETRGLVALGARQVTVPAHGTATVPVTADPAVRLKTSAYGELGGRLVATATDGTTVTTPVGLWMEPETVELTIRTVDRRGQTPVSPSFVSVFNLDKVRAGGEQVYIESGEEKVRVPAGTYTVNAMIATPDAGTTGYEGMLHSIAYLGAPEITLRKDTTLTFDARKTIRTRIATEKPTESRSTLMQFARTWDRWNLAAGIAGDRFIDEYYTAPTLPVSRGTFELGLYTRMYAPELQLNAGGQAVKAEYAEWSAKLDGTGSAELVADPAAAKDKVALVKLADTGTASEVIAQAQTAGAKAIILSADITGRWNTGARGVTIPVLIVTREQDAALRTRLGQQLQWKASAASPYVYNLAFVNEGHVNLLPWYRVKDSSLGSTTEHWYGQRGQVPYEDSLSVHRPGGGSSALGTWFEAVRAGTSRTAFYTPDVQWQQFSRSAPFWSETMIDLPRTYRSGQAEPDQRWYGAPLRSALPYDADGQRGRAGERDVNLISAQVFPYADSQPGHYSVPDFGDLANVMLYRNGELLGETGYMDGAFEVPAEEADYRLVTVTERFNAGTVYHPGWTMGLATKTDYRFRSAQPSDDTSHPLPLLVPEYDVEVDAFNLAPATAGFPVTLAVTGQRGYTPGAVTSVKAWTSVDDGASWTEAPVAAKDGKWVASVDNSRAAGGYVSLKVDFGTADGTGVEQAIVRAYGVR